MCMCAQLHRPTTCTIDKTRGHDGRLLLEGQARGRRRCRRQAELCRVRLLWRLGTVHDEGVWLLPAQATGRPRVGRSAGSTTANPRRSICRCASSLWPARGASLLPHRPLVPCSSRWKRRDGGVRYANATGVAAADCQCYGVSGARADCRAFTVLPILNTRCGTDIHSQLPLTSKVLGGSCARSQPAAAVASHRTGSHAQRSGCRLSP